MDYKTEKGRYTLDGDWIPEGKGYNIDGDLVELKPGVLGYNCVPSSFGINPVIQQEPYHTVEISSDAISANEPITVKIDEQVFYYEKDVDKGENTHFDDMIDNE